MNVLVVEDNRLVLNLITKSLEKEGFHVIQAQDCGEAIEKIDAHKLDLIITDLNLESCSGLEIIYYLRKTKNSDIPIMVVSGENQDESVIPALIAGADDYVSKPLSMAQLIIRAKKILNMDLFSLPGHMANSIINKKRVGVVIPCYNEAERLKKKEFNNFVRTNSSYLLCFVNDGSKDNTLEILQEFEKENPQYIKVLNCEVNGGKSEAVRQGMLHLNAENNFDYLGFLDADLSTDFEDFEQMIALLDSGAYRAVVGSRISRVGAKINRESTRALISSVINKIITSIIKMPFQDTQCGAKIFKVDIVLPTFSQKFVSRWLFDVEIFIRLRRLLGSEDAQESIYEYPLKKWIHMDGSKLGFGDSLNIFRELFKIKRRYRK